MMKIKDIHIRLVSLGKYKAPIDYEYAYPPGGLEHFAWALIQVFTDEEILGLSRIMVRRGQVSPIRVIEQTLKPIVLEEDPRNIERLWWLMYQAGMEDRAIDKQALVSAMGVLDIAFWDILGKSVERPVWRLLGGMRTKIPVMADPIHYSQGEGKDYQAALQIVEKYIQQGYGALKIHLYPEEPTIAIRKMRETRRLIGDDKMLAVDLMGRWDPWLAAEAAQGFEQANICWLEDPFLWDDRLGGLVLVGSRTSIPMAGGERENTLYAWRDYIEVAQVKFLLPDTVTGGGISQMKRVADLALAHHVRIVPHGASYPEFGAQVVAAVSNGFCQPLMPKSFPMQIWSRLYQEPLRVEYGYAEMPERSGLGMEFDEDFITRYQV